MSALRLVAVAASFAVAACAATRAPPRAEAYADFLVGRVASMQQDHEVAADRYFSALARAPQDSSLIEGAINAALASGDADRARRAAAMASDEAPAAALLVQASEAIVARRWRAAEQAIERVEGDAIQELEARLLFTWIRTAQGRVDEAAADLGPLARIQPYGALFAYQQAMAFDYAQRPDEALAAFDAARAGGLRLPAGIERHADLLARRGARDQAVALLSETVGADSPALTAALARAQAGQAVAASPLTPARGAAVSVYGLGAIMRQEADSGAALRALTLALMLDPELDAARLALAQVQAEIGHADAARAALEGIAPTSPYYSQGRLISAWILLDAGREEEAVALARVNAQRGDPIAVRALADMYRNLRRFEEAEPIYTQLIDAGGEDWRLYFSRGATRERMGRWPEAEADLRHALELSPDQPDVLNYLGYYWVDRGERLDEALAMLERAVLQRPRSGAIIDSLGWAHYRLGDYAQALIFIERAVELEPADPTLNDHLGDVYWRLGRRIEARFQWRRALSLAPDDPAAIEEKLVDGLPDFQGAAR